MSDHLTPQQRHKNMAAIHSRDTKPEWVVRKGLWSRGFRYRLNSPKLPGHPDLVLRKYRTCIFVNGCFWHGHHVELERMESSECCKIPRSNREFWVKKISRNKERDIEQQKKLAEMGWHCITVWECELTPKRKDETLASLAFTLNHIFLQDHSVEEKPYRLTEKETDAVPMAADKGAMKQIEVVAAIIRDEQGRVI